MSGHPVRTVFAAHIPDVSIVDRDGRSATVPKAAGAAWLDIFTLPDDKDA